MTLPARLKLIAEYAGRREVVADIGTDHALIPVFLVENRFFTRAYACDIGKEPLSRAEKYIKQRKLTEKIKTILSDGLENVPNDADTIIIAGMGGELITDILRRGEAHYNAEFILQPMTAADTLRLFLYENGFEIIDEDIVSEKTERKLYTVIKARKSCQQRAFLPIDILISPALQRKNTPEKKLYIEKLIGQRKTIIENMKKALSPDPALIEKLNREIGDLEALL